METSEDQPLLTHPVKNLDLDKLLSGHIGEFGRYQKLIYLLVCLPSIFTAIFSLGSVFTAATPLHRCQVPHCDNSPVLQNYEDAFDEGYAAFTIPRKDGIWDGCRMFKAKDNDSSAICLKTEFSPNVTVGCEKHLFSEHYYTSTLVTEFNLICGNDEWKIPLTESAFFAGVLAGAVLYGQLSDIFGRRSILLLGIVQMSASGIASAFVPTFTEFVATNFFLGMAQVGVFQTAFIMAIEMVGKSKRVLCGVVIEFFFVVGELLLVVIAWYLRDWRKIYLVASAPTLLFLSYYFILPESIRWLIVKKKFHKAEKEIANLAKWNKVEVPTQQDLLAFQKEDTEEIKRETILVALKSPVFLFRMMIIFYSWMVVTMVYYGISMKASSLSGNIYLNFTIMSLAEIPGYIASYIGMNYLGRRITMTSSLITGGLACLAMGFIPATMSFLNTLAFLTGKFGASCAFGTIYLYTSELFPTTIRNVGVGLSSMNGRIGAILCPYVALLSSSTGLPWLPFCVFAITSISSGFLILFLPETVGVELPRTVKEAEQVGKTRPSSVLVVNAQDTAQELPNEQHT